MKRLALLVLLAVACKGSSKPAQAPAWTPSYHVDPALAGTGKTFMVASEAEIATKVGRDVLAHGGNAADAAVATCFALAVVHPSAGNLGGGGFAVIRTKDEASALDFRETAPAKASPDMFMHAGSGASLRGNLASGVPGTVAGLWELHVKHGKLTWQEDIAPAIALARDGFPVDPILAKGLEKRLARAPINGGPWSKKHAAGELVKQPELADTLQRISEQGPSGFYQGPVAEAIATEMAQHGGLITTDDLKGYQALWRDPLRFDYRGKHLITMPPPSSGGIVVAMTGNMLAGVDLAKLGWHSAQHVHWLVEVWRRAYAARNELLGDPAFVPDMPVTRLTSKEFADAMVATIGPSATPSKAVTTLLEGIHTTNVSIVDGAGMAIAITVTLNTSYGSGVWVAGFLMNNEMDDFTTLPGTPNAYGLIQGKANEPEPGKRMLSSMSPTIIEDDHGVYMVVGGQGGSHIITEVWQTISNVIDFGLPIEAAISAPRVHHQHLPDEVDIEPDAISPETSRALKAEGYNLVEGKPERVYGAVTAIVRTQNGWRGAADPRNGGAAMGD